MQEDSFTRHSATPYTDLVNAVKANDEKTLQYLYRHNYGKVEYFVLQNNGTADQAKDIFQEAFISMWRNVQLNKFIPKAEHSLEAYLMQIAKNKWLDYLRSAGYKKTIAMEDATLQVFPAEEIEEDEKNYIEEVKKKFQQLGDNCREVLTRFYYKKEPLRTIAADFNWTEKTAKNNKYRCLERLRAMMKNSKQ